MTRTSTIILVSILVLLVSSQRAMSKKKHPKAPPSCEDVSENVSPCLSYLQRRDDKPTKECCRGVKRLRKHSKKQEDRTAICECLESLAPLAGPVNISLISDLPQQCKVKIDLPKITSLSFNCTMA